MYSFLTNRYALFITLFFSIIMGSCVKTEFDEPPFDDSYPELNANFSIKALKALHTTGNFEQITEDYIIKAVVIADDESGNYYKTIVVQDSTGGMEVKINVTSLFGDYPIGRKIFIKLKGLTIGDYAKNFQLGGGTYLNNGDPTDERLGGIEMADLNKYIVKGALNQALTPKVKTINSLTSDDVNTLIQINDLEFISSALNSTFADAVGKVTKNTTLQDCNNNTITLRTSGYANFAGTSVPGGNGTFVGVYSVFNTTNQVFLRQISDIQFVNERCGSSGTGDIDEGFTGGQANAVIDKEGWSAFATVGQRNWIYKNFSGNDYAQATSYNSNEENVMWMVTPLIDLSKPKKLSFESATSFWVHDGLEVLFSSDFNGSNATTATWTKLNAILAGQSSGDNNWVASGDIDLSGFSGKGYIAFKYSGNSTSNTSTYRIDNVKVVDK